MFQAALGGAVLFNPEREADPLAVAAGLAVILLPYSVVGPFAGALLDRWDRRRVLLVANLVRAVLTLVVAAIVFAGVAGPPLYLAALAVAGVSRFVLAGLSAVAPARRRAAAPRGGQRPRRDGRGRGAALGGATAIGARALARDGRHRLRADDRRRRRGLDPGRRARRRLRGPAAGAGPHGRAGPHPRRRRPRAGRRRPGHRAHADGRGVVRRAGRAPAGVRRVDPADPDAVPAHVHRHGCRCAAGWPAWGRPSCWPPPGSASPRC